MLAGAFQWGHEYEERQPALPWNHWALAVVWVHQSWLHHWRFEKSRHFLSPSQSRNETGGLGTDWILFQSTEPTLRLRGCILCSLPVLSSADGQYCPLKIFLNLMVITLFFVKDPIFIWEVRLFQIKWLLKLIWDSSIGTWTSFWLTVDAQEMVIALNWKLCLLLSKFCLPFYPHSLYDNSQPCYLLPTWMAVSLTFRCLFMLPLETWITIPKPKSNHPISLFRTLQHWPPPPPTNKEQSSSSEHADKAPGLPLATFFLPDLSPTPSYSSSSRDCS